MSGSKTQAVLFDWGDTVMRNFPSFSGPMHSWPKVEIVSGVRDILEALRPSFTLALATNAVDSDEMDIRRALDRCGLEMAFDFIFCFRQIGHRKSEPEYFRAVLKQLEMKASEVFMVGDSFEADVRAANALGMAAVWFNPDSGVSKTGRAHRTIHRMGDLMPALADLGARVP